MEVNQCAQFIRKVHLFHDLKDEQLPAVAEKLTEVSFAAEATVFEQGSEADSFYLIYSGKMRVVRKKDGKEEELATLVAGDYFGEMALVSSQLRSATVEAVKDSLCLRLSKTDFQELIKNFPSIMPNLEVAIASRKLARSLHFKWLGKDEVVYFLARKHSFFLLQVLIVPVLILLIPAFLFLWGALAGSQAALGFGGVVLVLDLLWIAWRAIDWGNDYYIVTNQRVVWLEKVIFVYDSRTEAPLSQVLSVGVETDMVGRMFDFGNVMVRTFVGAIPFRHVLHPNQAAHMVEEYWNRTQKASQQAEKEAFKDALRQRLGLIKPGSRDMAQKQEAKPAPPKPNFLKIFLINLFKQRIEEGNTITYRKHWYVLIKQVLIPSLILIALIGLTVTRLYTLASDPNSSFIQTLEDGSRAVDTIAVSLPFLMIPVFLWWVYQYIDWTNDIFRVTGDQVFDIDKKPFGSETSRAAPLANILGTRYERIGVLGYMLNFGTVFIDVGSAQFAFEDVLDPAIVQSDIDRRRMSQMAAKKAAETATERNRMVDWLSTYYQNIDEIQKELEARDAEQKNG